MKKIIPAVLILIFALAAFANMPAPFQAGEAAFEPLSGLVSPTNQSVLIDLTGLATDQHVVVVTTLTFKDAPVLGAYGLEMGLVVRPGMEVLFDNVPVDVSSWPKSNGLGDWNKPEATEWLAAKKLAYAFRAQQGARGSISASDRPDHTLVIRERLEPSRNVSGDLTKYWQFAYIFGRKSLLSKAPSTDVEVRVPEGWDVVTTPMVGAGDGILKGIVDRSANPEAVLVTTTLRAPASYWRLKSFGGVMLLISLFGVPLIGALLCWLKFSSSRRWWLWGVGFNLLWPGLTALSAYLSQYAADLTLPDAQIARYGYDDLGSMILVAALTGVTFVLAFPLWLVVYRFATRKSRAAAVAEPPAES